MRITTTDSLGVNVLSCHGVMLLENGAEELAEAFERQLRDPGRGIVLDLTRLTYLDSAGVGTVVSCAKQASAAGTVMKIALAATGPVRRIFEVTQLERGFEIFLDADAAAASFK
jgi:anti-anti-sigma factor